MIRFSDDVFPPKPVLLHLYRSVGFKYGVWGFVSMGKPIEPTPREVRTRILEASKVPHRMGLMYGFLVAGRASEIVGRACPSDVKTTPRGPTGKDFETAQARVDGEIFDAVVFTVRTSKRGGIPRSIGLPLDPEYEPWAKPVMDYFEKFGSDEHVFPYTRQALFPSAVEVFGRIYVYPIEEYTVQSVDQAAFSNMLEQVPQPIRHLVKVPRHLREERKVTRHQRWLRLHGALRHFRLMELTQRFGFNREDRKVYAGHTIDVTDRYTHLDWQSYFSKLLIKRSFT